MNAGCLALRTMLLSLSLLLAACAGSERREAAPVERRTFEPRPGTEPAQPAMAPTAPRATSPTTEALPQTVPEPAAAAPSPTTVRTGALRKLLESAQAARQDGDWDRAQAALERGLRLAPGDYELWYELALTHYRRGDFDQALQLAQRALSLSPPLALAEQARALLEEIGRARGAP